LSGPLSGSTAVVTGASRGIGRAIAIRLAEAGAEVALWARDSTALRMVASEIASARGKARAIDVDVNNPYRDKHT
jgi:short-subunit dehydrogenase